MALINILEHQRPGLTYGTVVRATLRDTKAVNYYSVEQAVNTKGKIQAKPKVYHLYELSGLKHLLTQMIVSKKSNISCY